MPFILDASVTAAWLLPDEEHPLATHLEEHLPHDHFFVPPIWWFEVRNLLVVSERRMRLTLEQTAGIIANLAIYPIVEDNNVDEQALLQLARAHALSIYDASYLELAGRLRLPLATLDKQLVRAAEMESVQLVTA